jgi:hypothetical protein
MSRTVHQPNKQSPGCHLAQIPGRCSQCVRHRPLQTRPRRVSGGTASRKRIRPSLRHWRDNRKGCPRGYPGPDKTTQRLARELGVAPLITLKAECLSLKMSEPATGKKAAAAKGFGTLAVTSPCPIAAPTYNPSGSAATAEAEAQSTHTADQSKCRGLALSCTLPHRITQAGGHG